MDTRCAFCGRRGVATRGHHVVPRCKGGRVIVDTCRTCEDFIHKTWSHNELRDRYNTVASIQATPQYQAFLRWLMRQPRTVHFRTARARTRNPRKFS